VDGLDLGAELEAVPRYAHSSTSAGATATAGAFSGGPSGYAATAEEARTAPSGSEPGRMEPAAEVAALAPSAYAGVSSTRGAIAPVVLTHERPREIAARSAELDALIARYAAHYRLPLELVRRVVRKESNFNPAARNRIYWGLMQIRHDTARTMGYRGPAEGLLDAETNLNYAVRYLRVAYITAGGNQDQAVRHYQRGYYFHARDRGLLEETGLGRDRRRRR
jgi:soluble lytic murein transglycosylase-like protein